jgi:hypothetical protein
LVYSLSGHSSLLLGGAVVLLFPGVVDSVGVGVLSSDEVGGVVELPPLGVFVFPFPPQATNEIVNAMASNNKSVFFISTSVM